MQYFLKRQVIVGILLLVLAGIAVPVMADNNSPVIPPKLITLAPISLSPELWEKYSEQTKLVKVKATVAADGIIAGEIKIIAGSGEEAFDQAVIAALQKSVFTPAYTGAKEAVTCSIILPLTINVEKYQPEEEIISEPEQTPAAQ